MKRSLLSLILFYILFYSLQSQIVNKDPLSSRITGYKIDATLNVTAKIISGKMEAFWVNESSDIVPDIQLHLYLNAFKSNKTTFFRESPVSDLDSKMKYDGWIEIKSITGRYNQDLIPLMQYVSPDDGNMDDNTRIRTCIFHGNSCK